MITERIFHWAQQTPYGTAVIHNGERLSYRSFARSIAKTRGYFVRRGFAGPGHAVLAVRNLKDYWILSLALRSLGLTTLSARSTAAVQQLSLPDLALVATLPGEDWPGLAEVCTARGLTLASVALEGEPSLAPDAHHPMGGHIVWTSGTTGDDKMVLLDAADDAYFLPRRVEIAGMTSGSILCMFNISGASAAGCRWTPSPWMVGGATLFEQGERHQALRRPGITHAMVNPAILASLLATPSDAFPRNDTMRLFVTGGAMTRAQVERARDRITPHIFNVLASTETGPMAVTRLDTTEDHRWHRLLPGHQVELVDESGAPTPAGEIGEIRIGTHGGATGYLNDETATLTFFRDGFFYPGDLAELRSDGRMALHGRVTDVINVQGKKISPTQIEERLADFFQADGVCLFSTKDELGEEELHVVLETPAAVEAERMGEALSELRGFRKALVHVVPQMPRNAMGKIVRREVRALTEKSPALTIQW